MSLPDHPRSRGVYYVYTFESTRGLGSSPLARGLPHRSFRAWTTPGIIPARAGFTGAGGVGHAPRRDHPRSRGVYPPDVMFLRLAVGSSPLARGLLDHRGLPRPAQRIIPARAGFTGSCSPGPLSRWDHPRSRGVYRQAPPVEDETPGSSPLARGLPYVVVGAGRQRRIIPARAGFTHHRSR